MLKWIVGSKVDHPLADPRQARALIAELPAHDPVKSLEEITAWLESLNEAHGLKLERLFELAEALDTTGRSHHRKLVVEYLAMSRQQKFQENKLWTCGYQYSRALGNIYLNGIRQYEAGASGAGAVKKQLPAFVARALRAHASQVKWTMLRYGPFEPQLWSSIGELYRNAVKGGFAQSEVALYSGVRVTGSVDHEYLKIMMLWASRADVLPPLKQEITERIVSHFARSFRLSAAPFEGAMYAFDTGCDRPPVRLFGKAPVGNLCFFGPGAAPAQLAEVIASVEQTGAVPSTISLGAPYAPDTVLGVLKHLASYWSGTPPSRASERRAATARITVVAGYSALLDELERDESDALNFSVSNAESWVVENVSANGYGALVPASTSDWIRVGEMIGLQVEGTQTWGVGLIRRVMRDEHRQYHVGVEVVSRSAAMVRISQGELPQEGEHALVLSAGPDANGRVGMIMRAGRYDPNLAIGVLGRSESYCLEPACMVEAGDDFDWGLFKVVPSAHART